MTLEQFITVLQGGGPAMAVLMGILYWLERVDHGKTRDQLYKALDNTSKIANALARLTGVSEDLK